MTYSKMDLGQLFKNGNTILFLWKNEEGWPLEFASSNSSQILGFSSEELIIQNIKYLDLVHPEDSKRTNSEFEKGLLSSNDWFQHSDFRLRKKDGSYIYVSSSNSIERNEQGQITKLFSQTRDISYKIKKEELLEESKNRLELVLEGTRLGMWDWNPQTNDVHFDELWAKMLGYEYSEIEHNLNTWSSKVHPDDLESCFADITKHMEGKVAFYENVHRMKHKNGEWKFILDRGKIVAWDSNGKPIRFTGTHTDITKEKMAEQRAIDSSKAKSFFLANMSHEIRTPLHGILGMTNILSDSNLNPEQKEIVETIKVSGESLLSIINDILDLSKIEAGKLEISNTSFNIRDLANNTVSLFQERILQKKLLIHVDIEPSVPQIIESDEIRLRQILSNLISNAIKFSDSGTISLRISADLKSNKEYELQFQLSDSGKGIAENKTEIIFERFSQENSTIGRTYGGTGLGLPICKQLTKLLGGDIGVKSSEGKGSVFTFTIVCREGILEKKENSTQTEINANIKILVADDNPINLMVFKKLLNKKNIEIVAVVNGQEALDQLNKNLFSVAFIDLRMPVLDGFDVVKTVLENNISHPPMIALTADAFDETKKECLSIGFNDFLAKPFKADVLKQMILKYT